MILGLQQSNLSGKNSGKYSGVTETEDFCFTDCSLLGIFGVITHILYGEVVMGKRERLSQFGRRAGAAGVIFCLLAGAFLLADQICSGEPLFVFGREEEPLVLIDPGHGGIDGGAENASGTCEKDINLAICRKLRDKLAAYDVKVEMTRDSDRGLYTGVKNDGTDEMEIEGRRSIRSLKSEDLNARRKMADDLDPDVFISIHLNSFKQDRSVFGAQTFYTSGSSEAVGEKSKDLAERIQAQFIDLIDNGNDRTAMNKNDVLIMKNAKVPTVIAECGFLSNRNEASQLVKEEYQDLLADAVKKGILSYLGIDENAKSAQDAGMPEIVVSGTGTEAENQAGVPGTEASESEVSGALKEEAASKSEAFGAPKEEETSA